jgi:hypothetical protein
MNPTRAFARRARSTTARHAAALGGLVFLLVGVPAVAQLRWDEPRIVLSATSFDSDITAHYRFRNTGDRPIRLLSADGACSCTIPELPAEPIPPGASGALGVRFVVGDRVGREERSIRVVTDDAPDAPAVLTLLVNIRELAVLRPRLVFWMKGVPAVPRPLVLESESGIEAEYGDPEVLGDGFEVRWANDPHKGRELVVTPADTSTSRRAEVRVPVTVGGRRRLLTAFAIVQ